MVKEPTMSVKEARKRLGAKYRNLSDDSVEYLVSMLSNIAKQSVKDLGSINL